MKVLITYASVGSGHFKAAEAIYNYLRLQYRDIQLELVDILAESNSFFRKTYTSGYRFMVTYMPWVWAFGFWLTFVKPLRPLMKGIHFALNLPHIKNFIRYLAAQNPDYVISTHFLPSEISAYAKKTYKLNYKLITVVTDFIVHPFWVSKGTDNYIVASDITKQQLISDGIKEGIIKVLGIPTDPKFLVKFPRDILCEKLGLKPAMFTVLVITGSFGIGPIEEIVRLLCNYVQVLVVCANNKNLYRSLKEKNFPNVKIFGFIDNVQELMAVSDVIITKPGGLTISEALAMDLVPVFFNPIPGQEAGNMRIMNGYGLGFRMKRAAEIKGIISDFRNNMDKLNAAREIIQKIKKPNAAKGIYDVICKGSFWPAN